MRRKGVRRVSSDASRTVDKSWRLEAWAIRSSGSSWMRKQEGLQISSDAGLAAPLPDAFDEL